LHVGLRLDPWARVRQRARGPFVGRHLRAVEHPCISVAGDLANAVDLITSRPLPPLAKIALDEGERVGGNLQFEMTGQPLGPFNFHNMGVVLSIG
jgi:NADH dehydrogenase FAD-containing subunit